MSTLAEQKSTLARLLATENIRVEHQPCETASFNTKTRVLMLPVWKDMTEAMYDMLVTHEVGHALYTPNDEWTSARVQRHGDVYHRLVNILEDTRIERLMKRKYPGMVKPMYEGHMDLAERGFYGAKIGQMATFSFPDRINVHFKVGSRANITFSPEEQVFIDELLTAESFNQILNISERLWKYLKSLNAQPKTAPKPKGPGRIIRVADEPDELETRKVSDQPEDDDEEKETPSQERKTSIEKDETEAHEEDRDDHEDDDDEDTDDEDDSEGVSVRIGGSGSGDAFGNDDDDEDGNDHDDDDPDEDEEDLPFIIMTDEVVERGSREFIDKSAFPTVYVNMPRLKLEHYVIPAAVTQAQLRKDLSEAYNWSFAPEQYARFMEENRPYVASLGQEFTRKRKARMLQRVKVSKTGKLDMKKIHQYRTSQDIFLQTAEVQEGQNHGMLMLIDFSGSMSNCIAAVIKQVLNLSMFCRIARIPFEVYCFTDAWSPEDEQVLYGSESLRYGYENYREERERRLGLRNDPTSNTIQITSTDFRLKELLNGRMTNVEFKDACTNLLFWTNNQRYGNSLGLGGTPLAEAIITMRSVADRFRKRHPIQVLNTIFLTDGDGHGRLEYWDTTGEEPRLNATSTWSMRVVLEDRATHAAVSVDDNAAPWQNANDATKMQGALLAMYQKVTGSRVIGMHLEEPSAASVRPRFYNALRKDDTALNFETSLRQFRTYKFMPLQMPGYTQYFLMPQNGLEIETVTMEQLMANGRTTIKTAFKKMQEKNNNARVFLNRFAEAIG